jgi:hypothetical protein
MMSDGFMSRWSRLKRGGEAPPPALLPEVIEAAPVASPEPEFDITTLPDIETATAETDFTAFLQKGVPEFLKRQALRRAWCLDPGIRDFVGPADYAWDFNVEGGVPGFSLSLGGDVKKLLAQAIGQLETLMEEKPGFLPPGATSMVAEPVAEVAPPEQPIRLAEAPEPPVAEPEAIAETDPSPPRRHGGAIPV